MGTIEELEARRAKLEARLAEVKCQERAARQARAARQSRAERKADTRRKVVLGGSVLVLLRGNPQLLDYLRRALWPYLLPILSPSCPPKLDEGKGIKVMPYDA